MDETRCIYPGCELVVMCNEGGDRWIHYGEAGRWWPSNSPLSQYARKGESTNHNTGNKHAATPPPAFAERARLEAAERWQVREAQAQERLRLAIEAHEARRQEPAGLPRGRHARQHEDEP